MLQIHTLEIPKLVHLFQTIDNKEAKTAVIIRVMVDIIIRLVE